MNSPHFCASRLLMAAALLGMAPWAQSEDWPTYRHDSARSGVTAEVLRGTLEEAWMFEARHEPKPAWPESAPRDYWHRVGNLKPSVTYDRAYHTIMAEGGVYFGSSADDRVVCLDAETGKVRWTFFTEGPVRLAPAYAGGRVYAGSDDGRVYCLEAQSGALVWSYEAGEKRRLLPGNGRVISQYPVRTGLLVEAGVVYFCAGIFNPDLVVAVALDAATGKEVWKNEQSEVSPQGYLLASAKRLFVPAGQTAPAVLDREHGNFIAQLEGVGGSFAVLSADTLAAGTGRRTGNQLSLADPETNESLAVCEGIRMVVDGPMAYIHTQDSLRALDRPKFLDLSRAWNEIEKKRREAEQKAKKLIAAKNPGNAEQIAALKAEMEGLQAELKRLDGEREACYVWSRPCESPYELILAGGMLYAGGDGIVTAYAPGDGKELWIGQVRGRAYGLSVANGKLLASTDTGNIHCFVKAYGANRELLIESSTETAFAADDTMRAYEAAAAQILEQCGTKKGYAVVLDSEEGRLACALAQQSEMQVIGLELDPEKRAQARARLSEEGLYGTRVTILDWDGKQLPFTSYMVNVLTRDAGLGADPVGIGAEEIKRVLRPVDGTACFRAGKALEGVDTADGTSVMLADGWTRMRRGALPGAGEWTQLYCDSGHTAASADTLEGPMAIQWFGEPGPRRIIDRHHRPMSPLFKQGRLFVNGDNVIFALDAYNGTPLWTLDIPDSRRIGALKNCGHVLLAEDTVYAAVREHCWTVRAGDGVKTAEFQAPQVDGGLRDWGYLDRAGEVLIGSAQKPGASFDRLSDLTCDMLEGDNRLVMMSDALFGVERGTGKAIWTYQNGALLNNGIALGDGRLYALESRNAEAMQDKDGRVQLRVFCKSDTVAVALDPATGKPVWEQPLTLPFEHIAYLNTADGVVLLSGTMNRGTEVYYAFVALDGGTGKTLWTSEFRALDIRGKDFAEPEGSHGEQWQHPVLIDGTLYARPFAFELRTGQKKDYVVRRGGHGCGGFTGSGKYLFGRGDNPRMYPLNEKETEGTPVTRATRPGCWLNMVPAGGLLLIPESSSGCTCAYAVQTSLAFIPRDLAYPVKP